VPFSAAGAHLRALGAPAATSLRWRPPQRVTLVGGASFGAGGAAGSGDLVADVAVRLPRACFLQKDYLDCRYHARRALYLARVASALPAGADVSWDALCDDARKPVLLLRAAALLPRPGTAGYSPAHVAALPPGARLRLLPSIAADVFPAARLAPGRGNLRAVTAPPPKAAAGAAGAGNAAASNEGPALAATPRYNASICEDIDLEAHSASLGAAAAAAPSFPAAVVLLKAWARSRGMLDAADGASGCMLAHAAAALLARGVLVPPMSPFQMFREALRALGEPLLLRNGARCVAAPTGGSGASDAAAAAREPVPPAWRRAFPAAVLLSPCGAVNYAARMSAGAVAELAAEAAATAAALSLGGRRAADAAMMDAAPPVARHDLHIRIALHASDKPGSVGDGSLSSSDVVPLRALEAAAEATLSRALGTRARRVRVLPRRLGGAAWYASGAADASAPSSLEAHALIALASLDPEHAPRLVDLGPSAEDKLAAASFRAFWGDKAELRRFADGAICEAVVWGDVPPPARHILPGRVASYALRRHMGAALADVAVSPGCMDAVLADDAAAAVEASASSASASAVCAEAPQGVPLISCLDRLGARLKGLSALPLRVAAVAPLSPAFRGMAPHAPPPHPLCGAGGGLRATDTLPAVVDPLEIVVSLEGSGSWPDHPAAAAKTRAAFGLALAASLGREFGTHCAASEAAPDVFFEGYAFRCHVTTEADMRKGAEAAAAAAAAATVHNAHLAAPLPPLAARLAHASASAGAAATHAALAPTVRLARRWLGAHLLAPHFTPEAVEMLCAAPFLAPRGACAPPASREAGLLAFLTLLATHDWARAPCAVDWNGVWGAAGTDAALAALATSARAAAAAASNNAAAAAQRPPLLLPCPGDASGAAWTRRAPCAAALGRAVALARVSAKRLAAILLAGGGGSASSSSSDALSSLFRPSLRGFDFVVRLRGGALPHGARAAFATPPATALGAKTLIAAADGGGAATQLKLSALPRALLRAGDAAARGALLVGFDPVGTYLSLLRARFGHRALFFADASPGGGDVIAVALRPGARDAAPALRLPLAACAAPVRGSGAAGVFAYTLNEAEFCAELAAMGEGLVASVEAPPAVAPPVPTAPPPREGGANAAAAKGAKGAPLKKRKQAAQEEEAEQAVPAARKGGKAASAGLPSKRVKAGR
jgi:U3 small nucleolar RNA-associated protein 22